MDTKRMPLFTFIAAMFFAVLFDIFSIIPFLGGLTSFLFINFARLAFWIAGYNGKGTTVLVVTTAFVELIPGFSIFPGCMFFVWRFYMNNRKNTQTIALIA